VRHGPTRLAYFGPTLDSENDGNAGNCPTFPPYDADECWSDGDAGLMMPTAFTIDALLNYVSCTPPPTSSLGPVCTRAYWGLNVDIQVTNNSTSDRWVNVLMDWDQNGAWQGTQPCPTGVAPEHVLVNLWVPPGYSGPLSLLSPVSFLIGPFPGYVWTRFTISETMVPAGWDGSGIFADGETCDYLLRVDQDPTAVQEASSGDRAGTRLLPGQPNPFRGTTTLLLQLARGGGRVGRDL
jgi:hypothetical protein